MLFQHVLRRLDLLKEVLWADVFSLNDFMYSRSASSPKLEADIKVGCEDGPKRMGKHFQGYLRNTLIQLH